MGAAAFALACSPQKEQAREADTLREAFREAIERSDRATAIHAVEQLRDSLPDTPASVLEAARMLELAGDGPQSSWLLEAGVRRFPERAELRTALARVAIQLGNPTRALAAVEPVTPDSDHHPKAMQIRASALLHLGDLEAALATLLEAEELYPDQPGMRLMRVAMLLSEGRQEEASVAIEEARAALEGESLESTRRRLDMTLALVQSAQGEPEPAIATLREMRQPGPDYVLVWRVLLGVLTKHERIDEAIALLESDLARDDAPSQLHAIAARAYAATGDDARAEAALRTYATGSDSAAAYLPLVLFYSQREKVGETILVLADAVSRFPRDPMLRRLRCEAYLAANDVDQANRELEHFRSSTYPDDPQTGYLQARLALANGDARVAEERLRKLAPRMDEPATHFWLAKALEARGDVDGARRRYGLAMQRDPTWPPPHAALLQIAARRGDARSAVRHAKRLYQLAPWRSDVLGVLIEALNQIGETEAAERLARRSLRDSPDDPDLRLMLARTLRARGRYDEALAEIERAARAGSHAGLVAESVLTLGMAGRVAEGITRVRDEIAVHPDQAGLHAALASLLFATGDAEGGAWATDRALELDPAEPRPLRVRCEFRGATGRLEAAERDCARYLILREGDPAAHFTLGAVQAMLNQTDAAIASYERAVELDPFDTRPRNNLAELLAARGDLDGALAAAQEAYRLDEKSPHVLDTLGMLYLRKGLVERAVSLLEDAHAADETRPVTAFHLALAYRDVGRTRDARLLLNDLQQRDLQKPGLPEQVAEALGSLP